MTKYVIIAAGGSGERFDSKLPKQYLNLINKPVIVHTVKAFLNYDEFIKIVVVVNDRFLDYTAELLKKYFPDKKFIITKGGSNRTESIKKGLKKVSLNSVVAIHDAVRPLISKALISKGFATAEEEKSAIPVIKIEESLRKVDDKNNKSVSRNDFVIVQTPQFFRSNIIKEAYSRIDGVYTDDATVLEATGITPYLFQGDKNNIKITTKEDLELLKCLMHK